MLTVDERRVLQEQFALALSQPPWMSLGELSKEPGSSSSMMNSTPALRMAEARACG
jgi:hypothetical protein